MCSSTTLNRNNFTGLVPARQVVITLTGRVSDVTAGTSEKSGLSHEKKGAPFDRVVRQTLDRKSKLCPVSVKTLSYCPNFVQSLSKACPMVVQIQCLSRKSTSFVKCLSRPCPLSKAWTEIGHSHPVIIQTLSTKILSQYKRMD